MTTETPPGSAEHRAGSRWRSTGVDALLGCLLLWMAFPPLGWSWLAWLAPVPWLRLVLVPALPGRRPYAMLWAAGLLFWIAMLQGIRLAHWLNHFGLLALSAYLAVYLPAFIALTRVAVHRWRWPLALSAPMVWVGLELLRGHLLTGFSTALLAHTQYDQPLVIQVADWLGAYGVSFAIMGVAAAAASALQSITPRVTVANLVAAGLIVCAVFGYGNWRLQSQSHAGRALDSPLDVALVQQTFNTRFEYDPQRNSRSFRAYWQQTEAVRRRHPELDLIVWPESMFTENLPEMLAEPAAVFPEHASREQVERYAAAFRRKAEEAAQRLNEPHGASPRGRTYLLAGTETTAFTAQGQLHYNTALLIAPDGQVAGRYYKVHPVMFGEYIPFGHWLPVLYRWSPMAQGLTPGPGPAVFEVEGVRLAPSICFESTVPHLIRRQVRQLAAQGEMPDVLVNVTNDGWFWGSSILDLQLACAVFRAVELRRPFLVAANAGISAAIDPWGRITQRGPRQDAATLVVRLSHGGWESGYYRYGDAPAWLCLAVVALLAATGLIIPKGDATGNKAPRGGRNTG